MSDEPVLDEAGQIVSFGKLNTCSVLVGSVIPAALFRIGPQKRRFDLGQTITVSR